RGVVLAEYGENPLQHLLGSVRKFAESVAVRVCLYGKVRLLHREEALVQRPLAREARGKPGADGPGRLTPQAVEEFCDLTGRGSGERTELLLENPARPGRARKTLRKGAGEPAARAGRKRVGNNP